MGTLSKLLVIAGPVYFLVVALARLQRRRASRAPIPGWVHLIAGAAAALGLWLAWESQQVGGTELWRDALGVVVLPVLTYIGYGFYGARYVRPPARDHSAPPEA